MKTFIDIVKKEHSAYPQNNTSYFENIAKITINISSEIPQEIKNGSEGDFQEDSKIPYDKNKKK